MVNVVSDAYSSWAAEYVERLASMDAVHPSDRQLLTTWADGIEGVVLDACCGPGQWTNFLNEAGIPALGVDLIPEFIEDVRVAYPGIPFRTGSLDARGASMWSRRTQGQPPGSDLTGQFSPAAEVLGEGSFVGPADRRQSQAARRVTKRGQK